MHYIVEAPDAVALGRAMKGLEVRMARALNKVMDRRGPVFADRYHAHLLESPREAFHAIRYVVENWAIHAVREKRPPPRGVDPYCSDCPHEGDPPLVAPAQTMIEMCAGVSDFRPRRGAGRTRRRCGTRGCWGRSG